MLVTYREFESLARLFLAEHPEIRHEWRPTASIVEGSRTDLICAPGEPREVYASLRESQITIGTRDDDKDFESFGRPLSAAQVAKEAFDHFVNLLRKTGITP
jgi:hypothetical protein